MANDELMIERSIELTADNLSILSFDRFGFGISDLIRHSDFGFRNFQRFPR
jgi:hypothetical protein